MTPAHTKLKIFLNVFLIEQIPVRCGGKFVGRDRFYLMAAASAFPADSFAVWIVFPGMSAENLARHVPHIPVVLVLGRQATRRRGGPGD